MSFAKTLMAAAAIATVSAQPVLAAEAAQKLSLKNTAASVRANTKAGKSKALAGLPLVLLILGGGLVVYGITEVVDDDDGDSD
ncbi:hypothetical protein SAMN06297144_3032 [Sphingomonas guangdongensis]|uniref:Uncharacterized protein n=1 Tax=Sphingomonas guangdongensis TaxID=1141890 RepID=A0A285R1Y8_9SPHN|nr:hypothetical protein [Sphingomonas guangdongensis]SOB87894.1 hypothetical protein SAMN06297144_3032 [Sphingomonas guangdongensis]